jgi:hypothetical protein
MQRQSGQMAFQLIWKGRDDYLPNRQILWSCRQAFELNQKIFINGRIQSLTVSPQDWSKAIQCGESIGSATFPPLSFHLCCSPHFESHFSPEPVIFHIILLSRCPVRIKSCFLNGTYAVADQ